MLGNNISKNNISDCLGCKLSKHTAFPFNESISLSSAPFDLIHSDIRGPYPSLGKVDPCKMNDP